ncbi:MAG: hypothetical protein ACT4QB_15680, partial [Gammaproteobacteria bacterium]
MAARNLTAVVWNAPEYFSDTELGPRPLVLDDLPPGAWTGLSATFHRFADRHYFAAEFPEQCEDGKGVSGTSMAGLHGLLVSHIPDLGGWPRENEQPDTVTAMDLVVFSWQHVQEPKVASNHEFFGHKHYAFDRARGQERWRTEVNRILERNGVALRLEPKGRVVRIGTVASGLVVQSPVPETGDAQLDSKVATALSKYQDPDVAVRREALEALWDAFERVKTVLEPSDKKRSAEALIDLMVGDEASRAAVAEEFRTLSRLGNDFQIRHHEVAKHDVEPAIIDLLFVRALALIEHA